MVMAWGSRKYLSASRRIWEGSVAEKSAVCRPSGGFVQDGFDIFDKAHAQHFIGFVQNDGLDMAQVK